MPETSQKPRRRLLSVELPNWLRVAIKTEAAQQDIKQQQIVYDALSARYPAEKRRHERQPAQ